MNNLFGDRLAGFDEFWAQCPVKKGKATARKAWAKLAHASRVTATAQVRSFYEKWQKEYPTASPLHPTTYLNGRRWEDYEDGATASQADIEAQLRAMSKSPIAAVREHANLTASRMGITL